MSNDVSYSQMDTPGPSEHRKYLAKLLWEKNGCIPQVPSMLQESRQEIILRPTDTSTLAIPAPLSTPQDNLLILAAPVSLSLMEAAPVSLCLKKANMCERHKQDQLVFCLVVITASFSSRNLQLAIISLLLSCTGMLYLNSSDIFRLDLFDGYSGPFMAVICLQTLGGLVVAATLKNHVDILKGFGTSGSIPVKVSASPETKTIIASVYKPISPACNSSEKAVVVLDSKTSSTSANSIGESMMKYDGVHKRKVVDSKHSGSLNTVNEKSMMCPIFCKIGNVVGNGCFKNRKMELSVFFDKVNKNKFFNKFSPGLKNIK